MDAIFQAISECQTLYPDPELSSEEDDDEGVEMGGGGGEGEIIDLSGGEFFTSPEGLDHLTPEGQVVLQHLERVFQMPTPEDFAQMVTNGQHVCMCVHVVVVVVSFPYCKDLIPSPKQTGLIPRPWYGIEIVWMC